MPTTCAKFGRVAKIALIEEPTIGAYGTDPVSKSFRENQRLACSDVITDLAKCVLNLSKIHQT